MLATETSGRPKLTLAIALGAYFLLLSLQARRADDAPNILTEWILALVSPVGHAAAGIAASAEGFADRWLTLRAAAAENVQLRAEVRRQELELSRLRDIDSDRHRLEALLAYREATTSEGQLARVLFINLAGGLRSVVIDRGTDSGVRVGSAVLAPGGVVGRVVTTAYPDAKVQLLIDANAAAGALVERTRQQGVLHGTGSAALELRWLARGSDVVVGDRVLSAGNDGVYPPGLELGVVTRAEDGSGPFREITVAPSVRFDALEAVLVLRPVPLSRALVEEDE